MIAIQTSPAPKIARALFVLAAIVSGCKHPVHESAAPVAKRPPAEISAPAAAQPVPAASARKPPTEADFILPDDAPIDPAEEQRALRHNCCDEER
jgi:hypothetical protein